MPDNLIIAESVCERNNLGGRFCFAGSEEKAAGRDVVGGSRAAAVWEFAYFELHKD